MNPKDTLLNRIVEAVLYEGYILYPYRPSSKKNQQRFTFGRVYPEAYHQAQNGLEPCTLLTQCLVEHPRESLLRLRIDVRFLHPLLRQIGELETPVRDLARDSPPAFRPVPEMEIHGRLYQTWQEAVERDIATNLDLARSPSAVIDFDYPASHEWEAIRDDAGNAVGVVVRTQASLRGRVEILVERVGDSLSRVTVRTVNTTPLESGEVEDQEAVLARTFASTHTILRVEGGAFISLTDPQPEYTGAAAECRNEGAWPVLVGDESLGERDTLLASPIILKDYPRIAAESAGNLYDATEIDEILTLRILTMTDEEKREMRSVDEHARSLLERTESLGSDHLIRMHGAMRNLQSGSSSTPQLDPFDAQIFGANSSKVESVTVGGDRFRVGDRVIVRPKTRADALDLLLAGKVAIIEALEEDAEGRIHVAVVLEEDPGRDLGMMRQPGHRFFYGIDEIEATEELKEASQ